MLHQSVKSGNTKSCGCLKIKKLRERQTTHGMSRAPEFWVWVAMRERCHNPKHESYHRYGGRGISVCERWRCSFEDFYADIGSRPSQLHSIERIDNDGDYEPGNCRWAVQSEQTRNTSRNKMITLAGRTQCLTDWARERGINVNTLNKRLRSGWTVEEALS